jgi:hypothetical protein
METLEKVKPGQDLKIEIDVKLNGSNVDLTSVTDAFFYVHINKKEQVKFAFNTTEGYEDLHKPAENYKVILPITRAMTASWPEGLITIVVDLISDDAIFPSGYLESVTLKYGTV